jgi:hypothetical protein
MKMTVLPSTHKMTDLDSIFPRVVILDIAMHGHKKNMVFDEAISMADKIRLLKIEKVNRDGNMAAHRIAAYCRTVLTSGVLHNSVPPCVKEQMMLDCNLNVSE